MKIVISPAKSLDFESPLPTLQSTTSCFLKEANVIHKQLKKQKPKQLMELMDISDKLADLNWQRNQERDLDHFTPENSRPAIYAFNGDVYIGLDIKTLPIQKLDILQDKLRILSGLYGLLKPLDLMQPYRLEMGTKFPIGKSKNLYEFWKTKITKELNKE
ncbi:MAG TPA: peroxide stress protein YaaA, partial [Flavobacterium sp.]|nr:peroxide stress protein YaaA [Flavobacterium sp.]